MVETTGDPRLDRELREQVTEFDAQWNRLPMSVRVDYAMRVGHVRLLGELAKAYDEYAPTAAEHLRAAVAALQGAGARVGVA